MTDRIEFDLIFRGDEAASDAIARELNASFAAIFDGAGCVSALVTDAREEPKGKSGADK